MTNLEWWSDTCQPNAVVTSSGLATEEGSWYKLSRSAANSYADLNLAALRVYDLTRAGNAALVLPGARELGSIHLGDSQRRRVEKLWHSAAEAVEGDGTVRITMTDVIQFGLTSWIDKDEFDAAIVYSATDTEHATALCLFGDGDGSDFRA